MFMYVSLLVTPVLFLQCITQQTTHTTPQFPLMYDEYFNTVDTGNSSVKDSVTNDLICNFSKNFFQKSVISQTLFWIHNHKDPMTKAST